MAKIQLQKVYDDLDSPKVKGKKTKDRRKRLRKVKEEKAK